MAVSKHDRICTLNKNRAQLCHQEVSVPSEGEQKALWRQEQTVVDDSGLCKVPCVPKGQADLSFSPGWVKI